MAPPVGEALRLLVVDSIRKVEGDVFFKKGHMALDWWIRASMAQLYAIDQ
jgi:hypothetical protein